MGIGQNGYWTKWALDQMGIRPKWLRPNGFKLNGYNEFRPNGNKPCTVPYFIMPPFNLQFSRAFSPNIFSKGEWLLQPPPDCQYGRSCNPKFATGV